MFVVFLRSPGGLEATKGPHSGAREYEAHHAAAGAAARFTARQQDRRRPPIRAPATKHTHSHARATMCVAVRRRPPTDGSSERHPNGHGEHASANASDAPPPPPPASQAGVAAHDAIDTPSIHEHQRAASTHTHTCDDRTAAYPSRQEAPPQRAASTTSSRARAPPHMPSAGAATPRLSSRRDRRSHRSHATASDTPAPHRTPRQPGASGNPIVASVTR